MASLRHSKASTLSLGAITGHLLYHSDRHLMPRLRSGLELVQRLEDVRELLCQQHARVAFVQQSPVVRKERRKEGRKEGPK